MPKEKAHRVHSLQPDKGGTNTPEPVMCKEGKGVRNFACQHYDDCLEKAAKGMWSGFTCRDCDHYYCKEEETSS